MSKFVAEAKGGKGNGVYVTAPQGTHQGVIVDIIDLGMVEDKKYNKVSHNIQFVYQLSEVITEEALREAAAKKGVTVTEEMLKRVGNRITIRSAPFNFALSFKTAQKQTALTSYLETVLGRELGDDERKGFDLESLLGLNLLLTVQHKKGEDGRVFANVISAAPWATRFGALIEAVNYTRVADREQRTEEAA
jgi:hypothetical protein